MPLRFDDLKPVYDSAEAFFLRLFPDLPRVARRRLEDLAVIYRLDPRDFE